MTTKTQPIQLTDVADRLMAEIEFIVEDIHEEAIAHKSALRGEIAQLFFDEKLSVQTTDYAFYLYSTIYVNTNKVLLNGQEKSFNYDYPFEVDQDELREAIDAAMEDVIDNLQDPTQYFSDNIIQKINEA